MNRNAAVVLCIFLALAGAAWWWWTEAFISDDSYFYLVIARNIATERSQTFSNIIPTNGFHPAWCYAVAGYDFLIALFNAQLLSSTTSAVPLAVVIVGLAAFQSVRLARNLGAPELLVTAVPLAFVTHMGVLFSEALISYLGLAWLCQRVTRSEVLKTKDAMIIGMAAALCFLSRLDSAFTVSALLAWWTFRSRSPRLAAIGAATFMLVVAPYLIANHLYFDGLTPVSGWMKSTFPHLFLKGYKSYGFGTSIAGYSILFGIIPLMVGLLAAAVVRPRLSSRLSIIYPLVLGIVGHVGYIALFTLGSTEHHWYYVQPVFLMGVALGVLVANRARSRSRAHLAGVTILAASLALTVYFRPPQVSRPTHWVALALNYIESQGIHDSTFIVSDFPGQLAFRCDNRVLAVDMLTANRGFYQAMTSSNNALKYMIDECARMGKPVSHVMFLGNEWLIPEDEDRSVVYRDPRSQTLREIGRLDPSDGLKLVHKARALRIWALQPTT